MIGLQDFVMHSLLKWNRKVRNTQRFAVFEGQVLLNIPLKAPRHQRQALFRVEKGRDKPRSVVTLRISGQPYRYGVLADVTLGQVPVNDRTPIDQKSP